MSEYQYYEFLAEASWGTHRIVLRLPRVFLEEEIVRPYCVEDQLTVSVTEADVIIDMVSQDEEGEWEDEDEDDSLAAIAGIRAELAAGDLRPLYLAWLAAYGAWERDEDVFDDEDEEEPEPPVPAGLGSLTAAQSALADFLRLDRVLLAVAATASPPLPAAAGDPPALAAGLAGLAGLPGEEKDRLLLLVAQDQSLRARTELLRGLGGLGSFEVRAESGRRVGSLLDAAALRRQEAAEPAG